THGAATPARPAMRVLRPAKGSFHRLSQRVTLPVASSWPRVAETCLIGIPSLFLRAEDSGMATPARKVKSTNVDGQSVTFDSQAEERADYVHEQEKKIAPGKLKTFFRTSRLYSRDNG